MEKWISLFGFGRILRSFCDISKLTFDNFCRLSLPSRTLMRRTRTVAQVWQRMYPMIWSEEYHKYHLWLNIILRHESIIDLLSSFLALCLRNQLSIIYHFQALVASNILTSELISDERLYLLLFFKLENSDFWIMVLTKVVDCPIYITNDETNWELELRSKQKQSEI